MIYKTFLVFLPCLIYSASALSQDFAFNQKQAQAYFDSKLAGFAEKKGKLDDGKKVPCTVGATDRPTLVVEAGKRGGYPWEISEIYFDFPLMVSEVSGSGFTMAEMSATDGSTVQFIASNEGETLEVKVSRSLPIRSSYTCTYGPQPQY